MALAPSHPFARISVICGIVLEAGYLPVQIDPRVSSLLPTTQIPVDQFRRLIGTRCWYVAWVLMSRRSATGSTHITLEGIRHAVEQLGRPMTQRNVKHALKRLRKLRLVHDVGWTLMDGLRGARPQGPIGDTSLEVYERMAIYDLSCSNELGYTIRLPSEVRDDLLKANTWGGARRQVVKMTEPTSKENETQVAENTEDSADSDEPQVVESTAGSSTKAGVQVPENTTPRKRGRPRLPDETVKPKSLARRRQKLSKRLMATNSDGSRGSLEATNSEGQEGPPKEDLRSRSIKNPFPSGRGFTAAVGGGRSDLLFPEGRWDALLNWSPATNDSLTPSPPKGDQDSPVEKSSPPDVGVFRTSSMVEVMAAALRGAPLGVSRDKSKSSQSAPPSPAKLAPAPRSLTHLLPPFPGVERLGCASIPPPPEFHLGQDDLERVEHMVKLYRSAVTHFFGVSCYVLARSDLTKSKHYDMLVASAAELYAESLPPAGWIGVRMQMWRKHVSEKRIPPLDWIFNAKHVEKWHGYARSEGQQYMGRQLKFGSLALALSGRWKSLHLHLLRLPDWVTEKQAADIVATWFPGTSWRDFVTAARAQNAHIQRQIDEVIASGAFVWGG